MEKSLLKYILLSLLAALLLSGCSANNEGLADQSLTQLSPPTSEIIVPTTSTPTMTRFPTTTPIPSATFHPVLPLDQAEQLVLELLNTNGGCDLPCWWGIDPQSGSLDEAISLLSTLNKLDDFSVYDRGFSLSFVIDPPGIYVHLVIEQVNEKVETIRVFTEQRSDPYAPPNDADMLLYLEAMENYRLESILTQFGQPAEIWVRSFSMSPYWFDTHALLYYPNAGIALDYASDTRGRSIDNILYSSACPNFGFIAMHLVDPSLGLSLSNVVDELHPLHKYMRLVDATDMSIEEFYQAFQNPDCETYLLTPMELWPSEYDNR